MEAEKSLMAGKRDLRNLLTEGLRQAPEPEADEARSVRKWIEELGCFEADPSAADSITTLPAHVPLKGIDDQRARLRAEVARATHTAVIHTDLELEQAAQAKVLDKLNRDLAAVVQGLSDALRSEAQLLACMESAGYSAPGRRARLEGLSLATMRLDSDGHELVAEQLGILPEMVRDGLVDVGDRDQLLSRNLLEQRCTAPEAAAALGMLRTESAWVDPDCVVAKSNCRKVNQRRRRFDARRLERKEQS